MEPENLLASTEPTVDPLIPTRVTVVIQDAWGLLYAQGGVVLGAMLRAAERVLDRSDLRLTSTSVAYCLPVPCGPVTIDVDVVRNGRRGAQVVATLRVDPDTDSPPNAIATSVFTNGDSGAPTRPGLACPAELVDPPADDAISAIPNGSGMAFLQQTEWRLADRQPTDRLHRMVWFRFAHPPLLADGTWEPSTLAVPGDALGTAVVPDESGPGDLFAVSLQISMQFHRPATGVWLGIDSIGFDVDGGIASGLSSLWTTDGELVATVTQTALLRKA